MDLQFLYPTMQEARIHNFMLTVAFAIAGEAVATNVLLSLEKIFHLFGLFSFQMLKRRWPPAPSNRVVTPHE